jgi:hypothetical protein
MKLGYKLLVAQFPAAVVVIGSGQINGYSVTLTLA